MECIGSGYTPLQLLSLVWTEDIWKKILESSNGYVQREKISKLGAKKRRAFEAISMEELKSYMGLRLHMGIFGAGRKRDFWDPVLIESKHVIEKYSEVFSRNRWEDLSRQIHYESQEKEDKADKLWKIRGLCDSLNESFRKHWKPFQHLAIDEETIPTKARIKIKQYNPRKPANTVLITASWLRPSRR